MHQCHGGVLPPERINQMQSPLLSRSPVVGSCELRRPCLIPDDGALGSNQAWCCVWLAGPECGSERLTGGQSDGQDCSAPMRRGMDAARPVSTVEGRPEWEWAPFL